MLAPSSLPALYWGSYTDATQEYVPLCTPPLQVSGLGPACVLWALTANRKETAGKKLERLGENSWPFEAKIGQRGTRGTVDCHLFGQARLLPLCLGHCRGDKGASDRRLPSSQEGGRAGVAGRVSFQMKLCAWGLGGLRPHSCVSVCSACQAPYLVSQPPGDRSGPYCSSRE